MYYNKYLRPPIQAKFSECGRRKVVPYIDNSTCEVHGNKKQSVSKPLNGIPTRNISSPRPNINGNHEVYRAPPRQVDGEQKPHTPQELYDNLHLHG
ncbi:hypothetical protein QE152_g24445 [Popillia japonica]|uniref:Uncharacterized protein n=1 Tax=Popillia japonica TaxID=7064 RepID=A0AAW1KEG7_POPJA